MQVNARNRTVTVVLAANVLDALTSQLKLFCKSRNCEVRSSDEDSDVEVSSSDGTHLDAEVNKLMYDIFGDSMIQSVSDYN